MLKENQTTCKAVATSWDFDVVGGYEVVKVLFELRSGDKAGQSRQWTGFLSSNSVEHTLRSLRHCGWVGETFGDMSGMGTSEVEVVLEARKDGEKTYEEVRFVNRPPRLMLKNPMNAEQLQKFSESMARLTRDSARNYGVAPVAARAAEPAKPTGGFADMPYDGPPDDEDSIPF
jgi:hypothetical protein